MTCQQFSQLCRSRTSGTTRARSRRLSRSMRRSLPTSRLGYVTLRYLTSVDPCVTLFCVARIYAHIINILWRINTRWFRPHGRPWPVRSPWRVEGWVHSSVEVHAQGCFIAVAVTIVIAALDGIQSSDLLLHCDLPSGSPYRSIKECFIVFDVCERRKIVLRRCRLWCKNWTTKTIMTAIMFRNGEPHSTAWCGLICQVEWNNLWWFREYDYCIMIFIRP